MTFVLFLESCIVAIYADIFTDEITLMGFVQSPVLTEVWREAVSEHMNDA